MPFRCVLCHETSTGFGNNPSPIKEKGRACDKCNLTVILFRLALASKPSQPKAKATSKSTKN